MNYPDRMSVWKARFALPYSRPLIANNNKQTFIESLQGKRTRHQQSASIGGRTRSPGVLSFLNQSCRNRTSSQSIPAIRIRSQAASGRPEIRGPTCCRTLSGDQLLGVALHNLSFIIFIINVM